MLGAQQPRSFLVNYGEIKTDVFARCGYMASPELTAELSKAHTALMVAMTDAEMHKARYEALEGLLVSRLNEHPEEFRGVTA